MERQFLNSLIVTTSCVILVATPLSAAWAQSGYTKYSNKILRGSIASHYNQTAQSCASLCNRTKGCKAFSFSRSNSSKACYLHSAIGAHRDSAGTDLYVKGGKKPQSNNNSNQGWRNYCNQYANAAVNQNKQAIGLGCGYRGGGWQSNHSRHFNWCMGAKKKRVDYEHNVRVKLLNKCKSKRQPTQSRDVLGRVWYEAEVAGWKGVWTRIGNSNQFNARFQHPNGTVIGGRLRIQVSGNSVRIDRWNPGTWGKCVYTGKFYNNWKSAGGSYRCTNQAGQWMPWYRWAANIQR